MRVGLRLAAALSLLVSATALAGDKDELEVIGFSEDSTVYAYYTFGVFDGSGFAHAELNVFSTLTGKKNDKASAKVELKEGSKAAEALGKLKSETAKARAELKLGKDPGAEMYRSGTSTRTSFTVAGKAVEVWLEIVRGKDDENGIRKDRVAVRLSQADKKATLLVGTGGYDYTLNSARLSADGRSLVVMLKHSAPGFEGPDRRFLCAAGRLPSP